MAFERVVLDAGSDAARLPGLVEEVRALEPDLLVTWGTSVTLGLVGTVDDDPATRVSDVPAVLMIVAEPVGAGIAESYEHSGRPLVTGTRNRVPEETQLRLLLDHRPFARLGVIYNDTELNAVLKAAEVRKAADELGITIVERVIDSDALISVSSPYYNVGQLAGRQAERILVEGRRPGELEVVGLERVTVLINLDTAERLELYPPLLL